MVKHKKIKCHVMTMYDWLKRNHPKDVLQSGGTRFCPWIISYGLVGAKDYDCENGSCEECWNRPFRGIKND